MANRDPAGNANKIGANEISQKIFVATYATLRVVSNTKKYGGNTG
jgi:hypothetical protein